MFGSDREHSRAGLRDRALHADAPRRLSRRVRVRGGHLGDDGASREAGDRRSPGSFLRGGRGGDRHRALRPHHLQRRLPVVSLPSPHAGTNGDAIIEWRVAHLLLLRPGNVPRAQRSASRCGRAAGRGNAPGFVAAAAFSSREAISEALSASFPRWEVVERRYRQEFSTLADLLRSIRYTGTRGAASQGTWSPGKLARVEEAYRERNGGITATYQVFLCRGAIPEGGTA
jgi:hypothetical protein